MNKVCGLFVSILIFVLCANESSQNPQHLQQQDGSVRRVLDYNLLDAEKINPLLHLESKLATDGKPEHSILHYLNVLHRRKRASNDIFTDQENDLDELLSPSSSAPVTVDLDSLPPVIKYLVEQKLKEQRSRMTPRLGRDIEDDDCQRPRPPFAPRLGKKSVPFKPRLGRRAYEDTRC